jgi:hypothetical protein
VRAEYGAGEDEFSLAEPKRPGQVLFCKKRLDSGAGGAGGQAPVMNGAAGDISDGDSDSGVKALRCELWTDGAAKLYVTSEDYPPLQEELLSETDRCGAVTVRVRFKLEPEQDAGTD